MITRSLIRIDCACGVDIVVDIALDRVLALYLAKTCPSVQAWRLADAWIAL